GGGLLRFCGRFLYCRLNYDAICNFEGDHADTLLSFTTAHQFEGYLADCCCEDGVIFPHANVFAGVKVCSALTNDDVAGNDKFTAVALHTEALGIAITTVAA